MHAFFPLIIIVTSSQIPAKIIKNRELTSTTKISFRYGRTCLIQILIMFSILTKPTSAFNLSFAIKLSEKGFCVACERKLNGNYSVNGPISQFLNFQQIKRTRLKMFKNAFIDWYVITDHMLLCRQ